MNRDSEHENTEMSNTMSISRIAQLFVYVYVDVALHQNVNSVALHQIE